MKPQTLREKRALYLLDTILHYNSNNRAVQAGYCVYQKTKTSEGCAIGRKVSDKELLIKLDSGEFVGATPVISVPAVFKKMPKEIKELGVEFLAKIQSLHDGERNWDEHGLSIQGKQAAKSIQMGFDLIF